MQKITLTTETRRCINPNTFLGYEGENNANKLIFEFTDGFIDGLAVLKVERGETKGTIDLLKVEETYELEVKSSLLAVQGDIKFQFVITEPDGTITKYDPFIMTVKDALDADAELPEEYPSWQEIIATELAKVEKATENANKVAEDLIEAKENGEFNGRDGVDGKDGLAGKDGENGKDGKDGQNGADGYSPIANVTQTATGAIITVTDKNGTTTATVYNGKDGQDGTGGGSSSGGSNPTGTIISFMGMIAPNGYLICDGAELNISDYPNLASHFEIQFGTKNHFGGDGIATFAIPDMRDEFIRGYHGDKEIPLSGEIGIHQEATTHLFDGSYGADAKGWFGGWAGGGVSEVPTNYDSTAGSSDGYFYGTEASRATSNLGLPTTYTSRPTNVAVLFCIKY